MHHIMAPILWNLRKKNPKNNEWMDEWMNAMSYFTTAINFHGPIFMRSGSQFIFSWAREKKPFHIKYKMRNAHIFNNNNVLCNKKGLIKQIDWALEINPGSHRIIQIEKKNRSRDWNESKFVGFSLR